MYRYFLGVCHVSASFNFVAYRIQLNVHGIGRNSVQRSFGLGRRSGSYFELEFVDVPLLFELTLGIRRFKGKRSDRRVMRREEIEE